MKKYIELEAVLNELDEIEPDEVYETEHDTWLDCRLSVIHTPVADVVPKSEVDRLNKAMDSMVIEHKRLVDIIKSEVIEEFAEEVKIEFYREFDEIIPSIMADKIDGLKKKYTAE